MSRTSISIAAFVVGLLLLSVWPAPGAADHILEIAYTAELRGNLLPCNCPSAQLGGLARRVGWADSLNRASSAPLLVVDAGSALPDRESFPNLPGEELGMLQLFHLEAMRDIEYDALAGGAESLLPYVGIPWLGPNEAQCVEKGSLRIALVAVDEGIVCQPAADAVKALGPVDLVILLCAGDIHYAKRAARVTGAEIAIASRGACFHQPVWDGDLLLLGPGRNGKYVGHVRVDIGSAERVEVLDFNLRRMDATVQAADDWRVRVEELVLDLERRQPGALAYGE